jgi:hypothetical protein
MQAKTYKEEITGFRGVCKIFCPIYCTQHTEKVQAIKSLYTGTAAAVGGAAA